MCAGGAENIPTLAAELAPAAHVPSGAGMAFVVLPDEYIDVCCSGGVGCTDQSIVFVTLYKVHNNS